MSTRWPWVASLTESPGWAAPANHWRIDCAAQGADGRPKALADPVSRHCA